MVRGSRIFIIFPFSRNLKQIADNSGIALSYENQAINEKLESLESPSENVLDKIEYGGYETA